MSLNPLEQLNVITIGSVIAIWLAAFVVLRQLLFLPLLKVMEARQHKLDAAAAAAREAQALLERARAEAARLTAGATEQAHRLEQSVKDELSRLRQERLAAATAQAQELSAKARQKLLEAETAARAALERQLLEYSRQALLKVIPEVDDRALEVIVRRTAGGTGARR